MSSTLRATRMCTRQRLRLSTSTSCGGSAGVAGSQQRKMVARRLGGLARWRAAASAAALSSSGAPILLAAWAPHLQEPTQPGALQAAAPC